MGDTGAKPQLAARSIPWFNNRLCRAVSGLKMTATCVTGSPKCKQQAYRNRQREMEAMHAIAVLATISDDELADLKNWRPSADRVLPI